MRKTLMSAALGALLALCGCAAGGTDVAAVAPQAQPAPVRIDDARIDAALQGFVDNGLVAGASALVYHNGEEAYFGAFGLADRENGAPMARNTIVQIYSMTKPVTGVALMQLYEQGKFQFDDPIAQYLPEFANLRVYAGPGADGQPAYVAPERAPTVRDFLRHTAGLVGGPGDPAPLGQIYAELNSRDPNRTLAESIQTLAQVPLAYQPGAQWRYSDSVDVQARLVEVLSGEPFDQYLRRHVLDPLGMAETRYVVPEADYGRWAAIYRRVEGGIERAPDEIHGFNARDWPYKPGSFGLTSTLDDYMRFARMLQNEGELDGVRILRPETVRLMATNMLADSVTERLWLPSKGQVGFGVDFAVRVAPPASAAEASGAVGEFFWDGAASTLFWVDPANDVTAVFFVQLMPFDGVGLHKGFRDAIYAGSAAAAPLQ